MQNDTDYKLLGGFLTLTMYLFLKNKYKKTTVFAIIYRKNDDIPDY